MFMPDSTLTQSFPLNVGGNQAPSPFQGEGWDGGDISNMATNLDVSNAA